MRDADERGVVPASGERVVSVITTQGAGHIAPRQTTSEGEVEERFECV